jgi:FtsH-binding integral membrane protein
MNKVFSKMFAWLFAGILLTFATAMFVTKNTDLMYKVYEGKYYFFIILAEIITVVVLSSRIHKMSFAGAIFAYLLYSFLTGLTLSAIFAVYPTESIMYVFGITAAIVLVFSLICYFTNLDLTKISTFLFMGLLGLILCEVVNIFVASQTFNFVLLVIGVLIFIVYIAFDIQKVKQNIYALDDDKLPLMGALELYMDFINLFIRLLELFGKGRD